MCGKRMEILETVELGVQGHDLRGRAWRVAVFGRLHCHSI